MSQVRATRRGDPATGNRRAPVERLKLVCVANPDSVRLFLLGQLRICQEAGYEVHVVCSPSDWTPDVERHGITVHQVEMPRAITPLRDLLALARLVRLFRRERFSIVHSHNPKPGLLGRLAAKISRVPVVVHTVHGFHFSQGTSLPGRAFFGTLERLAAACADLVFSVNREDVQLAVETNICPPAKMRTLGSGGIGTDLTRFHPGAVSQEEVDRQRVALGIGDDHRVVGLVAPLVREKGVVEFLEAAAELSQLRPETLFLIVGPTSTGKRDQVDVDLARALGVGAHVRFLGWRLDVPQLMALMDVLTLPSYREGLPRSLMEGCAMGLPLVATDIRGCREVVEHGVNGFLVPPRDSRALAASIQELLENPELRRQMGAEGRRKAAAQFDERRATATVLEAYEELLHAKGLLNLRGNGESQSPASSS